MIMVKRSATATIAGYLYQFDFTIKCLLDLSNDNDCVDVENIEDIDVHSCTEDTAIQCKYYAGTKYSHSIIAKSIRLMLNHYSNVKSGTAQPINYKLYGYYQSGQEKLATPITVTFLKEHLLTYAENGINKKHHDKLGLNDVDLADFLAKLTIDIDAEEDSIQFQDIISKLKQLFNCDDFEAEHYYYNNALKIVSHTAKQSDINQRKIIKRDFIQQINKKEILFNTWFMQLKGEKSFYAELRKKHFSSLNTNERFFLIEIESDFSKSDLKDLLLTISNKWTKISKREVNPFCPFVYIHNIGENNLTELKTELRNDNFKFIDGHDFNGATFSQQSIVQVANHYNQIKLKIINTLDDLKLVLQTQERTQEIYQFYLSESFFDPENQYTKHIKIQFKKLLSIKEII
jgi:hypothetical protein